MRYEVLGLVPDEVDINSAPLSEDEQRVQGNVVYQTDDRAEAAAISRQGGFANEQGKWVVVTGVRDTQAPPSTDIPVAPFPEKS